MSGIGGEKKPGIVHRLDKDTSGVMVAAKNDKTHDGLSKQFAGLVSKATNIGSAGIMLICSETTHPSKLKTSKL